jgi:hypothetical protein
VHYSELLISVCAHQEEELGFAALDMIDHRLYRVDAQLPNIVVIPQIIIFLLSNGYPPRCDLKCRAIFTVFGPTVYWRILRHQE